MWIHKSIGPMVWINGALISLPRRPLRFTWGGHGYMDSIRTSLQSCGHMLSPYTYTNDDQIVDFMIVMKEPFRSRIDTLSKLGVHIITEDQLWDILEQLD